MEAVSLPLVSSQLFAHQLICLPLASPHLLSNVVHDLECCQIVYLNILNFGYMCDKFTVITQGNTAILRDAICHLCLIEPQSCIYDENDTCNTVDGLPCIGIGQE